MSEIRFDKVENRYVIIAPERLTRPDLYPSDENKLIESGLCPFCRNHEDMTPPAIYSLKDENSWKIRVIPNLYKALKIEADCTFKEEGIYEKSEGFGAHEIIIDNYKHIVKFEELLSEDISEWLEVIKFRVGDLKKDIRLCYFSIFKNQGKNSGATLPHIHTQLIAMPFIPREELYNLKEYFRFYKTHGRSIFCDILDFELEEDKRVFIDSKNFIAFCPYASHFAFEVMILPKFECFSILELQKSEMNELSEVLKESLKRLKRELGEFDYNIYLQNPPIQKNFETEEFFDDLKGLFRFYIKIVPRLYKIGGFELQTKQYINPIFPETVAKMLKK